MPGLPALTSAAAAGDLTVEELLDAALAAESATELMAVAESARRAGLHYEPIYCLVHEITVPLYGLVTSHMLAHDRWRRHPQERELGMTPGSHVREDWILAREEDHDALVDRERMAAGIRALYDLVRDRPTRRRRSTPVRVA